MCNWLEHQKDISARFDQLHHKWKFDRDPKFRNHWHASLWWCKKLRFGLVFILRVFWQSVWSVRLILIFGKIKTDLCNLMQHQKDMSVRFDRHHKWKFDSDPKFRNHWHASLRRCKQLRFGRVFVLRVFWKRVWSVRLILILEKIKTCLSTKWSTKKTCPPDLITSTNENLIGIQSSEIIGPQVCDVVKTCDLVAYLFWGYFGNAFGLCVKFRHVIKIRKVCATNWITKKICPPDLTSTTNENLIRIQSSEIIGPQVCEGVKKWYLVVYLFWGCFKVWYVIQLRQVCTTNRSTKKIYQAQVWWAPKMKIW